MPYVSPRTAALMRGAQAASASGLTLGTPVTLTSTDVQATYVWNSVDLGTADASRRAVIAVGANSGSASANITAVRIKDGGTTYTATEAFTEGNSSWPSGMFYASVPTGSGPNLTVEVDVAAGGERIGLTIWPFTSSQSTPSATSGAGTTEIGSVTTTSSNPPTVIVPTGGAGFAYARLRLSNTGGSTWTQTSGSGTEDYDASIGTSLNWTSYHTTAAGSQAFVDTWVNSTSVRTAAMAWAP